MIPEYPDLEPLNIAHRAELQPSFKKIMCGISEFTFANLFLFRHTHNYSLTKVPDNQIIVTGSDSGDEFFMLPFGSPDDEMLLALFARFGTLKAACEELSKELLEKGFLVTEDRDNFDYLYLTEDLRDLAGRRYHKKRNLVKLFNANYTAKIEELTIDKIDDARTVLDSWLAERNPEAGDGDYAAALEALNNMAAINLKGAIYYIEGKPVAYTTGEIMPQMSTFVTHFEKGLNKYKGLLQFVNRDFASRLPEGCKFINREQDLGDAGLRQAKESYRPFGFVRKYRVRPK
ncbi:MAG: DUF2156 domain-containing protein [Thermodesulfobacteriota bacterium]